MGVTHTASALNATGHHGLDKRTEVLVFHCTLSSRLMETRTIFTVAHRLVLQVTLTTPVANRAVKRVVHEQKLHDTLAGLGYNRRVSEDLLSRHSRECARCKRLRRTLALNQTHTAVTRHVEALVVTEAWDGSSSLFTGLN